MADLGLPLTNAAPFSAIRNHSPILLKACCAALLLVALSPFVANAQTRTVALTGQQPAGSSRPFQYFQYSSLNNHGDVAMEDRNGVWRFPGDGSAPLQLLPNTLEYTEIIYTTLTTPPILNDAGQVMLYGFDSYSVSGIYSTATGSTVKIAGRGSFVPGGDPSTFTSNFADGFDSLNSSRFVMNSGGHVAFVADASISGPGFGPSTTGVWKQNAAGNLEKVMQADWNDVASGFTIAINDNDQVAIGYKGTHGSVLVRNADGAFRTVASVGDLAPARAEAFLETPRAISGWSI